MSIQRLRSSTSLVSRARAELPADGSAQGRSNTIAAYRLQVTIETRREDLQKFEQGAARMKRVFKEARLELLLSAWDVSPVDDEERRTEVVRVYNLWKLGADADNLLLAMKYLGDTADYFEFEKVTFNEFKTLVLPLTPEVRYEPPIDASPERRREQDEAVRLREVSRRIGGLRRGPAEPSRLLYLKTETEVLTRNIAEYRARLESDTATFRKRTGWGLGNTYLGLTGRPNTVTQLWLVEDGNVATINSRLAAAPWDDLSVAPPKWRLLQPARFDPTVACEPVYDDA